MHLDDKKVHVQVEAVGSADVPEWLYGIVRANMVFLFKSELVCRQYAGGAQGRGAEGEKKGIEKSEINREGM